VGHERSRWPSARQKTHSLGCGPKQRKGAAVLKFGAGAARVGTGAAAGTLHVGSGRGAGIWYEYEAVVSIWKPPGLGMPRMWLGKQAVHRAYSSAYFRLRTGTAWS